jgi:hypothetical protein
MSIFSNAEEFDVPFAPVAITAPPPVTPPENKEGGEEGDPGELPPLEDEEVEKGEKVEGGLDFNGKDKEEGEEEEGEEGDKLAPELQRNLDLINNLAEKLAENGLELQAYEGWDEDTEPTDEVVLQLLEHNFDVVREEALTDLFSDLDPQLRRAVEYNLNGAKGDEVTQFLQTLAQEKTILALNPESEIDQEKIVRAYLANDRWKSEEVEEKVAELKESGLLAKEAKRLKPKLDEVAQEVAKKDEEQKRLLKQVEDNARADYHTRLEQMLQKGSVGGLSLKKDEVVELYKALTYDDVEVPVHGGKKVKMDLLSALVFQARYSKKGDLEALALATQVLLDKEKFKKEFAKTLQTEVTKEFVKNHKYSSAIKAGKAKVEEPPAPVKKDKIGKNIPWNFSSR